MAYYSGTKKIVCRNSYGYKLEFGYSFPFYLDSYSGIHNYDGNVATIKSAFGIGVSYIGTSVNQRNINLVIAFKDGPDLITRKQQLYNIFPLKDHGTLFYYESDIERKINYYVENVNLVRKANYVYATINLLCPSPYFMDSTETITTLNNWDKLLEFSLEIPDGTGIEFGSKNESTSIEIENNSHIAYGMTITFVANGTVVNPTLKNTKTGEMMKLNFTLELGEQIVIETYNNEKKIIHIDSNLNETNITNALVFGTKFLQIPNGVNRYVSSADNGASSLDCSISYYNYYEAV
jgi:uncharacterized protein (UPF0333 family)